MGKHAHTTTFRNCCRLFLRQNLSLSLTEVFCPCLKEKYIILWKLNIFHNYVNNLMWTNFHIITKKMNRFQWNQLISRNNWNEQILTNFQKRALYRLQILHRKLSIFKRFLAWYQKRYFWWKIPIFPIKCYIVQCHYMENCLFLSNHQISMKLQIPRKSKKYQILGNFQEMAFHHLVWLYRKSYISINWPDFKVFQEITCLIPIRFQRSYTVQCIFLKNDWNEQISMKSKK